ncbi:uncharacterized protein ACBT44_003437 isoform 2-T3 [Syngnathus typhle]
MVKIYMVLTCGIVNLLSRAVSSKDAVGTSATCWPKIKALQNHAEAEVANPGPKSEKPATVVFSLCELVHQGLCCLKSPLLCGAPSSTCL